MGNCKGKKRKRKINRIREKISTVQKLQATILGG